MQNAGLPCCYHPTRVIVIDDNQSYLNALHSSLSLEYASYEMFSEPLKALHQLQKYHPHTFLNRCLVNKIDTEIEDDVYPTLEVNVRKIHEEIYSTQRFNEISVIIVDCVMPGIDGFSLCEKLYEQPFRKILLTGEAQESQAIHAFNKGIIQKFVRKQENHFSQVLQGAIADCQMSYFLEQSRLMHDYAFTRGSISPLQILDHPAFIAVFEKLRHQTQSIEYYLLDRHGSFLFLDAHGRASWLLTAQAKELENYSEQVALEGGRADLATALKEHRVIPYFHTDADWRTSPSHWQPFLHPATHIPGTSTYYAFLPHSEAYQLKRGQITSFADYLEQLN